MAKQLKMAGKEIVLRVVIIEDDETIRNGYSYLINATGDIEVIKTYASFEDAARHLATDQPDVILLDVELPGISGIQAIKKIKKILPSVHVILLTVYENEEMIFEALSNGASGYLAKNISADKIIQSIKEVMEGGAPMSANVARMVIKSFQRNQNTPLTKRETEVLDLVAAGNSRKRIAEQLFVDLETIKTHIKNIYAKLDVHSRADAIKTAKENKFI